MLVSKLLKNLLSGLSRKKLSEKGYRIISKGGECDLKVDVGGEVICVEVKGRRKSIDELDYIELTENETVLAQKLRDKYWLVLVESIPNNPRIWILKDPAKLVTKIKISSNDIKRHGEVLE